MRTRALVPLSLVLLATPLSAQTFDNAEPIKAPRTFIGGSFLIAEPQQEFADHVNTSYGGSINLIWKPIASSPSLGLRFEGGVIGYGSESKRVPFSETVGGRVMVDVTTSNMIAFVHAGPQLMLASGFLRPYLAPTAGITYITTVSSVSGNNDSESGISDTNYDDLNFSYGATGGLYVPITSGRVPVLLDLGLRYYRNGVASYLVEGSIRDNPDGSISFDPIRSRADMLTFQIGVTVGITTCSKARCPDQDD